MPYVCPHPAPAPVHWTGDVRRPVLAGFEARALPAFGHREHVRVAVLLALRHGRHAALALFSRGIKEIAAAAGRPEKYHETVTRAWFDLIEAAREAHPDARSAAALLDACPELLDQHLLRRYYSAGVLESDAARRGWLPPDGRPMAWPPPPRATAPAPAGHNAQMPAADPITTFLEAVARARAQQIDTTPVTLATADRHGRPSARMVLLRGADARGFAFFTNYNSRKARELTENPQAALCIHWPSIEEQIRIEGRVERLPDRESDAYFAGRPRGSQIGAWASDQSQVLVSREVLEERYRDVEQRFEGREVERPPFWGGFLIVPDRVEFWQGRNDRLHDRLVYVRDGDGWRTEQLYP